MSQHHECNSLSTAWTSHINDQEEKIKFVQVLKSSRTLTDQLIKVIEARFRELTTKEYSDEAFEKKDWAYYQAFLMGQKKSLGFIKDLLDQLRRPDNK